MSGPSRTAMPDGARIRWWRSGPASGPPVVLLHGGPGLPDYLEPVARLLDDVASVHRYDQRGTGGSDAVDDGRLERHVADLAALLDAWGLPRAAIVGHSYGTDLAVRFADAHPQRVARLVLIAGPFTGDWRDGDRAERQRRMTDAELDRLEVLAAREDRTEAEEVELLTLSWFTDHADPVLGRAWAAEAARTRRPVAWEMNRRLGEEGRADPLEDHLDVLRGELAGRVGLVGGAADPRPASALESLAARLDAPLELIEGAGHEPWLERPDELRRILRRAVGR